MNMEEYMEGDGGDGDAYSFCKYALVHVYCTRMRIHVA